MNNRGFIALMSVIVISAVLLVLVFVLGTGTFFNRFDALDVEQKQRGSELATSCVEEAMLRLLQNNYTSDTLQVGGGSCMICKITPSGLIQVRAVSGTTYTNLIVNVNPATLALNSWLETPTLPSGCMLP